jgi:hypothetical protein
LREERNERHMQKVLSGGADSVHFKDIKERQGAALLNSSDAASMVEINTFSQGRSTFLYALPDTKDICTHQQITLRKKNEVNLGGPT